MSWTKLFAITGCLFWGLPVFAQPEITERKQRIIHNNDGSDLLGNIWFNRRPLTVADLDSCVDMISNSQVTTYMICSGSDFFYVPSAYGHIMGDDNNGTLDCGCDTLHYQTFRKFHQNHLNLEKEGTDLIKATLTRARKNGMETFITYRMNDLHFNDTTTGCPIEYTDFWINHPEYWLNDTTQGYNSGGAFDYSIREVRDRKLAIITEQLERYEMIDGYDLDFMRFIVYFKTGTGEANAPLMTDLVSQIRAKVDELSAQRGKKILLSARVAPTVEQNLMKGLDIREWLRLGLLDFISIGVHWRGDPAMPVAKFREDLGDDLKIPFYCSIDDGGYKPREFWSHGMYRGMSSHILSQGADGLYLFNYYLTEYNQDKTNPQLEAGGLVCRTRKPELLQELGSLQTLRKRNKIYALSDGVIQYHIKPDSPLPFQVSSPENEIHVYIGDDVETDQPEEALLFIRTNRPAQYELIYNGTKLEAADSEYPALYDRERGLENEQTVDAFSIPVQLVKQGNNRIEFVPGPTDPPLILRAEIALKYGPPETHGYF